MTALRCLLASAAAGMLFGFVSPASAASTSAEDQRLADVAPFLSKALRPKTSELFPTIHWIGDADRFWMVERGPEGRRYVVVDAASGKKTPAFDHAAFATALGTAAGAPMSPANLPILDLDLTGKGQVVVATPSGVFVCAVPRVRCSAPPAEAEAQLVASPDGTKGVFKRGHDLWLRDIATGAERQLTRDGVEHFAYGDTDSYGDVEKVARRRDGAADPLAGVVWSPDSRYILGLRQDLRATPERLLVTEYLPPEGGNPVVYQRRAPLSGDAKRPDSALTLIDTQTGTAKAVGLDPQALNDWAMPYFAYAQRVWWSAKAGAAFLIGANRGGTRYQLLRIDLNDGAVRPVITETGKFSVRLNTYDYALPNVRVLASGREAIWYSDRDGQGHLYLYDVESGQVVRQLTKGDWSVADLVRVDQTARIAYFTAVGKEAGEQPVYRHLYKVSLDGGDPVLLTPERGDHAFNGGYEFWEGGVQPGSSFSPSGRYFVDSVATADAAPGLVIRHIDGRLAHQMAAADPEVFAKAGVRRPESFTVKAADGVTDLHGVLYKPTTFDPSKRYPVIEMTYPGPQGRTAPVTVPEFFRTDGIGEPFATAELGFIVMVVDGRGAAYRSKAFREAFFGTEDPFGAADHVAALRNLAATRPYLDLARVGVTGHSYGGYGSLRAMLLFPDVYKAGVSGVGPADWTEFPDAISTERYFGDPSSSEAAHAYYETTSNVRLLDRLQGRLMLIYGGIDEVVPLKEGFKLSDGLIAANKPFDFLVVPNSGHSAGREPYGARETMRFFLEQLGGPEPAGK